MTGRPLVAIAFAYVMGSLCAGYYVVRWRTGCDVRSTGSGAAGARNAGRLLGHGVFAVVLGLDTLKGAIAVAMARQLELDGPALGAAVVAVVVGHVLPIQLGFRGGRGIAPSIGAVLVYDPWILLASALVLALLYVLGGRGLVPAGLATCAMAPVAALVFDRPATEIGTLSVLAVVVLGAHHRHLRDMLRRATTAW